MSARFLHGAVNIKDEIYIFGGCASAILASSGYNDLWKFSQDGYERVETHGNYPTPRTNFAITQTNFHIFVSGGVFQRENSLFSDDTSFRDVFVYSALKSRWTKVATEGEIPSIMFIHRATMISRNEMVVFGGGSFIYSNPKILRAINEISVLVMNDEYSEGKWCRIKNWIGGDAVPARFGHHQHYLGKDTILVYGGSGSGFNGALNDAWIIKIIRVKTHEYAARAIPLTVINPGHQLSQSFLYPSCLINDKLVFVGCKNAAPDAQKFEETVERDRPAVRRQQTPPRRPPSPPQQPLSPPTQEVEPEPSTSKQQIPVTPSSSRDSRIPRKVITINNQLPLSTIGAMSAFKVKSETIVVRQSPIKEPPVSPRPGPSGLQNHKNPQSPEASNSSSEPKLRKINESPKTQESPKKSKTIGSDRKLLLFLLDLKEILGKTDEEITAKPVVTWLPLKNDGLLPNAPERTCYSTLTRFDNKIALIAGLQRWYDDSTPSSSSPTNQVHFVELPKTLL